MYLCVCARALARALKGTIDRYGRFGRLEPLGINDDPGRNPDLDRLRYLGCEKKWVGLSKTAERTKTQMNELNEDDGQNGENRKGWFIL